MNLVKNIFDQTILLLTYKTTSNATVQKSIFTKFKTIIKENLVHRRKMKDIVKKLMDR